MADGSPVTFSVSAQDWRDRFCTVCGGQFRSSARNAKYCPDCRQEAYAANSRAWSKRRYSPKPLIRARCAICGVEIVYKSGLQKYCAGCRSEAHRRAAQRFRAAHREKLNEIARDMARRQKDKRRAYKIQYRQENLEAVRAREAELQRRRLRDPGNRIHHSMSSAVRSSIKRKNGRSWESLVGYSLEQLMQHLERQFQRGMTWENYGRAWHIDHIIPRVHFSFTDASSPEFRACWALSNLQPLWAVENIRKHAKRAHLL